MVGALTVALVVVLTATAMAAAGTVTVDSNDGDDDAYNKDDGGSGRCKSNNITAVVATQQRQ